MFLIDEARVLADPTEPGGAGVRSLEQRRGIDAQLVFEVGERAQPVDDGLHAFAQDFVVVAPPGVARDPGLTGARGRERMIGVVQFSETEDGLSGFEQLLRIGADFGAAVSEITHLSGHATLDPGLIPREVRARQGGGNSGELETGLAGNPLDLVGCYWRGELTNSRISGFPYKELGVTIVRIPLTAPRESRTGTDCTGPWISAPSLRMSLMGPPSKTPPLD